MNEVLGKAKEGIKDDTARKVLVAVQLNQDTSTQFTTDGTSPIPSSQGEESLPLTANLSPELAIPDNPSQETLDRKTPEIPENLEIWPAPFDMADLAEELADNIRRHCILTPDETDAIVLWSIASYGLEAFEIFPRLSLISPEMRCGKSTTMSVIAAICRDGLQVSNVSPAIIYRLAENTNCTLLIDEADTFVKTGDPALIGLINSGHCKSTATVLRCTGDDSTPKAFRTWMPMVLASIGELSRTIMDRSITINLRRKKSDESVSRLPGSYRETLQPSRRKILTWCSKSYQAFQANPVEPPDKGNDRAADNWLPLFTIAECLGKAWPNRCLNAYNALTTEVELSLSTQLLSDIRSLFMTHSDTRISSEDLLNQLYEDTDGPWLNCRNGNKATPHTLASLLKPYGIKPKGMRWGSSTKRGYESSQFADAFERYL